MTGNVPVILRESLLPQVFEIAAGIVDTSVDLFGGMVGPFCVEGIVTEDLEFKVFEIADPDRGGNESVPVGFELLRLRRAPALHRSLHRPRAQAGPGRRPGSPRC